MVLLSQLWASGEYLFGGQEGNIYIYILNHLNLKI